MNILEEIKVFSNQENSVGALLITGKWGSGKTYFINEILKNDEEFQNKYVLIRISLFGETSFDSVNNKIKKEYLNKRFPPALKKKGAVEGKRIIKKSTKALAQVIPLFGAIDTVLSSDWLEFVQLKDFKGKKLILVFDDLERCNMSIQEILGCINEYVENQKIKTIMIADEEKIKLKEAEPEKEKKTEKNHITKEKDHITYDELKEKLICRTIKFTPQYSNIVKSVLNSFVESEVGFKDSIYSFKEQINEVLIASGTDNIRSLKCAIQDAERVYKKLRENKFDNDTIKNFISTFFAMVFEYKAGGMKEGKYGYIFSDKSMIDKYNGFKSNYVLESIRHWITSGEWNQERIDNEINNKAIVFHKKGPEYSFLNSYLFDIDDTILNEGYPIVLDMAYRGELIFDQYKTLLEKTYQARENEINLPIKIDYNKIKKGVEDRINKIKNNEISEPPSYYGFEQEFVDSLLSEERDIYNEIEQFKEKQQYYKNRNLLLEAVEKEDVLEVVECFKYYMQSFDKELSVKIFELYYKLKNPDRIRFGGELKRKWRPHGELKPTDIEESIEGFEVLKDLINTHKSEEQITKAIDKSVIKTIDEIIRSYKEVLV